VLTKKKIAESACIVLGTDVFPLYLYNILRGGHGNTGEMQMVEFNNPLFLHLVYVNIQVQLSDMPKGAGSMHVTI
jgi:hypothetical protein